MRRRAWLLYLSCVVAALLAFLFVPGSRQGWLLTLIALSSPIAIVIAVVIWKPEVKAPSYLFAVRQRHSSDVVIVVEVDSTIRYMSPSVERVFGYSASEVEGTKLTELIPADEKTAVLQFLTSGTHEGTRTQP